MKSSHSHESHFVLVYHRVSLQAVAKIGYRRTMHSAFLFPQVLGVNSPVPDIYGFGKKKKEFCMPSKAQTHRRQKIQMYSVPLLMSSGDVINLLLFLHCIILIAQARLKCILYSFYSSVIFVP